jgi:hypothetical protein
MPDTYNCDNCGDDHFAGEVCPNRVIMVWCQICRLVHDGPACDWRPVSTTTSSSSNNWVEVIACNICNRNHSNASQCPYRMFDMHSFCATRHDVGDCPLHGIDLAQPNGRQRRVEKPTLSWLKGNLKFAIRSLNMYTILESFRRVDTSRHEKDDQWIPKWFDRKLNIKLFWCNGHDNWARADSQSIGPDAISYCEDCFVDRFFRCQWCDETHVRDNERSCVDGDICASCSEGADQCIRCGIFMGDGITESIRRGDIPVGWNEYGDEENWDEDDDLVSLCSGCYNRLQRNREQTCEAIMTRRPDERRADPRYLRHLIDNGEYIIGQHDANIFQYMAPIPLEKTPDNDTITLGVELEVETRGVREQQAEAVYNLVKDFAILKYDGSLESGFEIVTLPLQLDVMKKRFINFFENRSKKLRSFDTGNCGMHIHIGREGLSFEKNNGFSKIDSLANSQRDYASRAWLQPKQLSANKLFYLQSSWAKESFYQIWKMWQLISAKENRTFINAIAQRRIDKGQCNHFGGIGRGMQKPHDTVCPGHRRFYGAVNPHPTNTVELRLFQGTLHYPSFCKNLEFAHALACYTRPAVATLNEMSDFNNFIAFVQSSKRNLGEVRVAKYPYLVEFLRAKGFIKSDKPLGVEVLRRETTTECA